ncbi:hypothetical protein PEC302107_41280 [Pectobacterium araliae]|uniref:SMI1/KNR4 family protein n=1 Tax=Pectobacterium araliae TaxID=3073862 RepID=UPI0020822CDD|nr:hypothetical protein PEC302107_41280 [Pectobacterium carotovorum subsp. carotovorum]
MNKKELLNLIEEQEDLVNFGTSDDAPTSEWIQKTEQELGVTLPEDYKWFLSEFGGGDICGEEIYSIYCLPFDEAVGGDLVYQNVVSSNNISIGKIVLSNTDFGEEYYFKVDDVNNVYVSMGNKETLYANDFIEYIHKRLMSYV